MTTEMTTEAAANTTEGNATSQAASTTTEATPSGQTQAAPQQQAAQAQTPTAPDQGAEGKPAGEQVAQAAPEKYEFKPVEGRDFDPDVIGAYSEVAKELNLSQDAAQKIIDKIAPVMADKQNRAVEQAVAAWGEEAKADKEFGGEKFDENLSVAKKALDTFGTPELSKLLNESGLGNHKEVLRFFYRAGKAISEDGYVSGKAKGSSSADSVAQRMYPNMNP